MRDVLSDDIRRYYETIVEPVEPADVAERVARGERSTTTLAFIGAIGAVLLVVGAIPLALWWGRALVSSDVPITQLTTTTTTVVDESAPTAEATSTLVPPTVAPTTVQPSGSAVEPVGPAPWSTPPLSRTDVSEHFANEWSNSENRQWCSVLAPASEAAAIAGATPRRANFGGGWAVAFDQPELRSAFGIAGVGLLVRGDTASRMPNVIVWDDGSRAGYTGEGFDASNPRRLAEIAIPGQGCLYQVWSQLGDPHLVSLMESLRFVDGLVSPTFSPLDEVEDLVTIDGGDAPWRRDPVDPSDVPDLLLSRWEDAGGLGSLVTIADLGPQLEGASIRAANVGPWGVAWDTEGGPGHDGFNEPCTDCGRGAAGLGAFQIAAEPEFPWRPNRVEWDDGSFAVYGSRLANNLIPRDRVLFFDPETGEEVVDGLEALVYISDLGLQLTVWTHHGEEHLLFLLDQLRVVATR